MIKSKYGLCVPFNGLKCLFKHSVAGMSSKAMVIIISVSLVGGVIFVNVCLGCIGCHICDSDSSDSSDSPRQRIVESREMIRRATRGLDQRTIETYKKMELGENIRLPGTNGTVCLICLSEYASKETVRFIPECNHCFHVECIDVWLKIHGSCPICRNSRAWR